MKENKPMPLLLIEDDVAECIKFKDCANARTDIVFVGMTGSSIEGLQFLKTKMPEGVILDLELHRGKGSGLQFLADLKEANIALRPLIVVTTNSSSSIVYDHVHSIGADLVFYKRQADYSPDMVISTILALRKSLQTVQLENIPGDLLTIESPEEQLKRITERIDTELDLIGIPIRYKGRAYLMDAILIQINKEKDNSEAVLNQVAELRRVSYSSIIRAIQTAINKAWERSAIEDLQAYYKAKVSVKTGVPSSTDFIHYYADKIRKTL